jgi:hypothetical protein
MSYNDALKNIRIYDAVGRIIFSGKKFPDKEAKIHVDSFSQEFTCSC